MVREPKCSPREGVSPCPARSTIRTGTPRSSASRGTEEPQILDVGVAAADDDQRPSGAGESVRHVRGKVRIEEGDLPATQSGTLLVQQRFEGRGHPPGGDARTIRSRIGHREDGTVRHLRGSPSLNSAVRRHGTEPPGKQTVP